jgi:hypothetical protein
MPIINFLKIPIRLPKWPEYVDQSGRFTLHEAEVTISNLTFPSGSAQSKKLVIKFEDVKHEVRRLNLICISFIIMVISLHRENQTTWR